MESHDSQGDVSADWYGDPTGRHQHRYWDGTGWTENVADDGQTSIDALETEPDVHGDAPQHAIVLMLDESSGGSTQYILTDVSRPDLEQKMLGSQLAVMLDIKTADQVRELLSQGTTVTTGAMGRKQTITIEFCACDDPGSHKRSGAAQLGG